MFMAFSFVETPVAVFPKRGILKRLDRCEQHVDQVVMESIILVRDERDQMNLNIIIGPAAQIGRAHSGDAAGEISNAPGTEFETDRIGATLARLHLLGPIFAIFAGFFAGKPLYPLTRTVWNR